VTQTATRIELESTSPEATMALAARIAGAAEAGDLVCLWGDLGAGKTVFAKGFGAGLAVDATINSPSFVLMAEYAGRLPLFHLDLYRLGGPEDVLGGGLLDDRQSAGVTLVEWPERLGSTLPSPRLDVVIHGVGEEVRHIELRTAGDGLDRLVAAARP